MSRLCKFSALCILLVSWESGSAHASPHNSRQDAETRTALNQMLESIDTMSSEEKTAAADRVYSSAPTSTGMLSDLLMKTTCLTPYAVRRVLLDALSAHRESGAKGGFNLEKELLKIKPEARLKAAYKKALRTVIIIQALAKTSETPAYRTLLNFNSRCNRAFRPEIRRVLDSAGERALPALILEKNSRDESVKSFVNEILEDAGYSGPARMVQVKNRLLLADVITALSMTSDFDAMSLIVNFADDPCAVVRKAAREAIARYGRNIIWQLRDAYRLTTGEDADPSWNADTLSRKLYSNYDELRLAEIRDLLARGKEEFKKENFEKMKKLFSEALYLDPDSDQRVIMAGCFRQWAQHLESEKELDSARQALFSAAAIQPDAGMKDELEACYVWIDALELQDRQLPASAAYEEVLKKNPEHSDAMHKLAQQKKGGRSFFRILRAAGFLLVLLAALSGFIKISGPLSRWPRLKS